MDDEALADHFDRVRERMRTKGTSGDDWEDIPASQNELTRGLRKGK